MRDRVWAAVVAFGVLVATGGAQEPSTPARELPPAAADPFTAPLFLPLPSLEAPSATLADAVESNSPRAVAVPAACPCDPGFTTWASAELLIGRTRGASVAPIVTTGPPSAGGPAGAVGQPGTLPLFGGKRLLDDWRTGLRIEAGAWLDPEHRTGVALRLYSLFAANERFRAVPNGAVVINVPQSVSAGGGAVQVPAFVGFPGSTTGRVGAGVRTTFAGGDLNWRCALERNDRFRLELLTGYRQLYLSDGLNVNFSVAPVGAPTVPLLAGTDDVRTRNSFYGPQLGLCAATAGQTVWLDGHAATALGVTASELDFARSRGVAAGSPVAVLGALGLPPTPANVAIATATGQIPAAQSNVNNRLTYLGVVGEGGVRLNWRAADHLRLTAGYSFLYWNNVRRAQEMFVLGPVLRPQAIDFTTHLFSVGLDVRF